MIGFFSWGALSLNRDVPIPWYRQNCWDYVHKSTKYPEDDEPQVPELPFALPGASDIASSPGSGMNMDGTMSFAAWMEDWSAPRTALSQSTKHPQARVRIAGANVLVDEAIAPLIVGLNQLGIRTVTSCQGDEDLRGYVMFDSTGSGE